MSLSLVKPQNTELKPRIVVFGVGGAGGNAVNNMIDAGLEGVEFVVANTDAQHLSFAKTDRRIQLGETITQGLGAGAHPEVGMNAAEESADEIHAHLEGAHMVFITCGMGGGTGTGAAPVIAKCARDRGILTVGVVTKPFTFEGRHRMRLADSGVAELQRYVDTLIVIPNQNLFRVANERTTFADAFGMADQVLHSGVRSITDLMILPGLINLDFADVRAVMSEMGKAMMGTGEATGDDRALLAAQNAIANPLLDETSLKGAKAVLVNITGGLDMTLLEVDEAANAISAEVDGDANIIFGAAFDPALEGKIRVSVVATGMDEGEIKRVDPVAPSAPLASHEARRSAGGLYGTQAPRAPEPTRDVYREPTRAEAPRAPEPRIEAAPVVPTFMAPPAREPEPRPEPVIRVAEAPRNLEPIVDPWVEEYETRAPAARAPEPQPDLYSRAPQQPAIEDDYDDRDHRRSGWSLFGRGKRTQPQPEPTYGRGAPQMRQTSQPSHQPEQEMGQADDDLEIPSFLRRLAN
ncbi:cell division protein FtsZ [Brevundimonas nasdae]|uniref:Cell division protein FtsZ n=1 Tax=Brevundimonas nasdae TaxID=172043 RepID=A0ABX8TKQ6_9CAUL|nr:cell division protein FtsZ [Brevundimonas nasdae]MBK6026366.1 cell division protein FtsZ [Brevundimonas nasdae]MDQ0452899.1 cell division protein FtsZ [Brevundimonas nasdae]QYC10637.1 cell division protein FtsZ [Brevundimonas nasdae]QYC13424.1 cell division protein FtsZ [Brevundimonas nasdae]